MIPDLVKVVFAAPAFTYLCFRTLLSLCNPSPRHNEAPISSTTITTCHSSSFVLVRFPLPTFVPLGVRSHRTPPLYNPNFKVYATLRLSVPITCRIFFLFFVLPGSAASRVCVAKPSNTAAVNPYQTTFTSSTFGHLHSYATLLNILNINHHV